MGTFAIDLLSGKQYLFNKTFGSSSGGTSTPVWGGIGGTITNQVDLINYFNTKVSNNVFTGYTASTDISLNNLEINKLYISAFTGYSAATDIRISALVNDYNFYNTESNILGLDPSFSGYVNQKIWATDTKREFLSQYVQTIGEHRWLNNSLLYDPATDTYYLGETADGQTQNIGQEIFLNAYNTTTSTVTTNNPKVFLSINTNTINTSFMDVVLARADDIGDGSIYGLNTTDANSPGYFKITTYGLLKNVNTSEWPIGTELYISDTVRGDLTSIKPENNAYTIGFVLKQHVGEGIIFVNTIRSIPNIDSLIPIAFDYSYFNGDLITTTAGTFYLNLRNDKGTVTGTTQTVVVPDNTIVGASRDSLSIVFPTDVNYNQGSYRGKFEISVNIAQANEKIYLEVYKADEYGNVIDSGIVNEPLGEYGVRPFLSLTSTILNLPSNTITPVVVDGILRGNATILEGERFRFHIRCEKIGTAGGNKTFTIHYGSTYDTWLRFPHYVLLDELYDVVTYNASAGTFLKKNSNGIWTGQYIQQTDVSGLTTILSSKFDKTGGTINGPVTINSGLTVYNLQTVTSEISFGTPRTTALPSFNQTFTYFNVLGIGGPNLTNITSWGINWNLTNNAMYVFAFGTNNGIPSYYVDLLSKITYNLNTANPYIIISGSGVNNLDGGYYVNFINGSDFIMAHTGGSYTIYMSTNPISYIPQNFDCKHVSTFNGKIIDTGIPVSLYGSYLQFIQSTGQTTTTNTSPVVKCELITDVLPLGNYKITTNFTFSHTTTTSAAMFDLTNNNSTIGRQYKKYVFNSNNAETMSKIHYATLSGINVIQLRFWNESADSTTISDASIEISRIN